MPGQPKPATGWAIGGVVAASPVAVGFGLGLPLGNALTLSLGLLAAGLIVGLTGRVKRLEARALKPFLAAALLIPGGLVAIEGAQITPFHVVPQSPVDLASLQQPLLVLPTGTFADGLTDGFPVIADDLRSAVRTFPDAASIAFLRSRGIRTVVAPGDLYNHEKIAPETSMKQVPGAVIFTLS
ncbi:hypothetical protein [Paractinoplanes toevensis]|uniref:Uncharacterized protein n=1 Tax=Paractinoplanes toevensis TaxID=571911 RepID=A0A919TDZ4_9ACTN|nr:hypothetical protein [Actinoplanes toevensis]GIM93795.1 hypothetical protein Ato02nite_055880 [Actinoplanes toevensis]